MMAINIFKWLRNSTKLALHIFSLLWAAFLSEKPITFFGAVFINFGARILHLVAFIASIQCMLIAFQYSISDGKKFSGKGIIESLQIQPSWLPIILVLLLVFLFWLPVLCKKIENILISEIVKNCSKISSLTEVSLKTDLFVIQRLPGIIQIASRFFSAVIFISCALIILFLVQLELFLAILFFCILLGSAILITNRKTLAQTHAASELLKAFKKADTRDPKEADTPGTEKQKEVPTESSSNDARDLYFDKAMKNWFFFQQASLNQIFMSGLALATVVLTLFSIELPKDFHVMYLLYVVIAIRYAINAGREASILASKILDLRSNISPLEEIYAVRKSRNKPGDNTE